jgi:hypothetical protein
LRRNGLASAGLFAFQPTGWTQVRSGGAVQKRSDGCSRAAHWLMTYDARKVAKPPASGQNGELVANPARFDT